MERIERLPAVRLGFEDIQVLSNALFWHGQNSPNEGERAKKILQFIEEEFTQRLERNSIEISVSNEWERE